MYAHGPQASFGKFWLASRPRRPAVKDMNELTDEKINAAINVNRSKSRDDKRFFREPILESKAISDLSKLTDAKKY